MMGEIETPCRRLCALDAARVCTGCGRTIDEIVRWGRMTPQERRTIIKRLGEARADDPGRV